jgi:TM2 domain-containing membrane protein YozV
LRGQILGFSIQSNSGEISGVDGGRYHFTGADWQDRGAPAPGMAVDFQVDGNQARAIYIARASAAPGSKSKITAGLLAILLGFLGIHKFYLRYTGAGLVYLLGNTIGCAITWMVGFVPNYALMVIAIVEGVLYLTKSDEEFERTYVSGYRPWF